jgi:hypothetical protein
MSPLALKLQQALHFAFGHNVILYPFPQKYQLGDFGWYSEGYFRIIWQQIYVKHLSFAWVEETDERLAWSGALSGPHADLMTEPLEIKLAGTNARLAGRRLAPKDATISINMASYDPSGQKGLQFSAEKPLDQRSVDHSKK